jgi:glycosyltransferase involved in cell wall biosynthesis
MSQQLITERQLSGIRLSQGNALSLARGISAGMKNPKRLLHLLTWILQNTWMQPTHLLKSLILTPRSLDIFTHLEKEQPEIVHLNLGHYPCLVGHLVQSHLPHIPVTISLAAYDLLTRYGGSTPVAQRAVMVRTLALANVEVVSRTFGIPSEHITVIYDGIDLTQSNQAIQQHKKVKYRIVTACKLVKTKGVDDALKVFRKVLDKLPNASLVILGDGPERQRLKMLSQELNIDHAVDFRGHVNHDSLFKEMAQAEVFLFMSRYAPERLPNVVKEAIACNCLCVVTRTLGIEELLEHDKHGYVVGQHDIDSAANYVLCGFEDTERYQRMTQEACRHLQSKFAHDKIIALYNHHWRRILDNR